MPVLLSLWCTPVQTNAPVCYIMEAFIITEVLGSVFVSDAKEEVKTPEPQKQ